MALCHMKRRVATATDMYDTVVVAHSLVTMRICYSDAPRICDTHKLRYLTGRGVLVQKRQYKFIKSRGLGDLIPDVVSEILAGKDGTHVTRSHYP